MKRLSPLRMAWLCYLSRPASERALYRVIRRHRLNSILEIGMGDAIRAHRMIRMATSCVAEGTPVRYTGIDLFEARAAAAPRVSLVQAYRRLRGLGAQVKLSPGEPATALAQILNQLHGSRLIVISASYSAGELQSAWPLLAKIAGPQALVLWQQSAGDSFHSAIPAELAGPARADGPRRAA